MVHGKVRGVRRITARENRMMKRAKRPALDGEQWNRLTDKVSRVTCSPYWRDYAAKEADEQGLTPTRNDIPEKLAQFGIYPPPPDDGPRGRRLHPVTMKRCAACRRKFPPQFISCELCEDCRFGPRRTQTSRAPANAGTGLVSDQPCVTDREIRLERTYEQFRKIGFNDREVAVLSLWLEGHNERRIADICEISKTWVHQILISARMKSAQSNLSLPERRSFRIKSVDPRMMDQMYSAPAA